jgi:type IV fimbrial biogenesis protein FimT
VTTHSGHTKQSGITLIEIMVTVAIAAILMSVAVPAFRGLIAGSRASTAANEILASLIIARSEAVKRGITVVVQAEGNDWTDGWEVSASTVPDPTVLSTNAGLDGDITIDDGADNHVTQINFAPDGTANTGAVTIESTTSGACRRVEILGSGKALIADCP